MAGQVTSTPTFNPANMLSLGGALQHMIKYIGYNTETCIPAIIQSYDRNTHKATVIPLVKFGYQDGSDVKFKERAPIGNITVMRCQHGGFIFDMPLYPGDTGWLFSADRDTILVKQHNGGSTTKNSTENKGPQNPSSLLYHKYNFGVFVPDRWGNIEIKEEDKDKLFIQSMNGKAGIKMDQDGNIELYSDGGKITCSSNLEVTGNIDATKNVTAGEDVKVKNSNATLKLHVHTDSNGYQTSSSQANENKQAEGTISVLPANITVYSTVGVSLVGTPNKSRANPGETITYSFTTNIFSGGSNTYKFRFFPVTDGVFGNPGNVTQMVVFGVTSTGTKPTMDFTIPSNAKNIFTIFGSRVD